MSPDEQVEWLDETGTVVALVSRSEMRARNLLHRSVYIAVLNSAGSALLAHRRAEWKDVWPGRWDIAFGGVVDPGESWGAAAQRELFEEAGISAPITELGQGTFEDDDVRCVARVHVASSEGPFTFTDDEVVETTWVELTAIDSWVDDHHLCPDSLALVLPVIKTR